MNRLMRTASFLFACCMLSLICLRLQAQPTKGPVILHMRSTHSAFPDSARAQGHTGKKVFYNANDHYKDSTVLLILPPRLHAVNNHIDLIFWFHGWHNNVDHAAKYYQLTRQLMESRLNAVLVLPEAARDAADSYGGKLEKPGVFKALVADVLHKLKAEKKIGTEVQAGNILLGGHSGGGEVISFIVEQGQIDIREVVLFDALYDGTEKFMPWLQADSNHRFIHLYTDYGYGPKDESFHMMHLLDSTRIPYKLEEEKKLNPNLISSSHILFIHSPSQHNDIIFSPDNFKRLFGESPFLKKYGLVE